MVLTGSPPHPLCRPDFEATFKALEQAHPGTQIGVFYCGAQPLSNGMMYAVTKWMMLSVS